MLWLLVIKYSPEHAYIFAIDKILENSLIIVFNIYTCTEQQIYLFIQLRNNQYMIVTNSHWKTKKWPPPIHFSKPTEDMTITNSRWTTKIWPSPIHVEQPRYDLHLAHPNKINKAKTWHGNMNFLLIQEHLLHMKLLNNQLPFFFKFGCSLLSFNCEVPYYFYQMN